MSINTKVTALLLACLVVLAFGVSSASAEAPSPWWHLTSGSEPTDIGPGGEGEIVVTATNLGDGPASGGTITDVLPKGLEASGRILGRVGSEGVYGRMTCVLATLSCSDAGVPVPSYEALEMRITVRASGAVSGEENQATVSGGGAPSRAVTQPITVSAEPAAFGVERYEFATENERGEPETQAGSHPFQLTTTFGFTQSIQPSATCKVHLNGAELDPCLVPAALPKDLHFDLPVGLVGNASSAPQCSEQDFDTRTEGATNLCPADTAIGVADTTIEVLPFELKTVSAPIFNLVPSRGEPARFGWIAEASPVLLDTSVRSGGNYGVVVSSNNISQLPGFLEAQTTFWGVPGDPRHNSSRGWSCVGSYAAEDTVPACPTEQPAQGQQPFLTLPTSCPTNPVTGAPVPLQTSVEGDSWPDSVDGISSIPLVSEPVAATTPTESLDGCNNLPFSAGIETAPDLQQSSTATGLKVDVHVPQQTTLNPNGISGSDVKEIKVTLPEGVTLNPSGGDGLEACANGQIGYEGSKELEPASEPGVGTATFSPSLPEPLTPGLGLGAEGFCPSAAKIGTVKITTPLLTHPLEGAVYLASQNANPFGSLVAIYIVAEDPISGVLVKLPGEVRLNGSTGQVETTIRNSPQLPFEDAELHFFGGERAPLSTPARCGTYTTQAQFTPWSGNAPVDSSSSFDITSGPNGGPCPGASLPFSPSLAGGTTNINAGAFSPLVTTIGREDGNQDMQSVQLHMPAGLSGLLSGVKLCGEAEANAGTCGPESQIGETTVSAGVGADPVTVRGGRVYITEKYAGAPFGLSIVNPVKTGPFDLEHDTSNPNQDPACDCVVVRAKIEVDPSTAALTITTNPSGPYAIPHMIDGIPVQIKKVNVTINRPNFTFNPTNCSALKIEGSIASDEGASSPVAIPFQATNCAVLKFAPKFSVSTKGRTNKKLGASLTAKVLEPANALGSQANITRVKVDLPLQLPSQLKTLQKACPAKTFEEGFEQCLKQYKHSKIGEAVVNTPLLPVPLKGPAIFVSHGGEAFPSLTIVLQGYGVTIDLVGATDIKNGITSTTFKTVPDVPFSSFELTLPQGEFAALAANLPEKDHGDLCDAASKLKMPTEFLAQNGAKINESTKIGVSGCPKAHKAAKKKKKAKVKKGARKSSTSQGGRS